ncbi:MAG: Ig-like domain-containing protein [Candidatus Dormiibacterota bacterium]
MRRSLAGIVAFATLCLPAIGPQPALAYVGQNCPTATITADPIVGNGGTTVGVTVTVTDCNGDPVSGVLFAFTQTDGPANCHLVFNPPQAVTDTSGQAHTTVTLPLNCPCQYTIQASAASVGIVVTTTVRENGCLPFTSAAAATTPDPEPIGPLAASALGLALIAAAAVTFFLRGRRAA